MYFVMIALFIMKSLIADDEDDDIELDEFLDEEPTTSENDSEAVES